MAIARVPFAMVAAVMLPIIGPAPFSAAQERVDPSPNADLQTDENDDVRVQQILPKTHAAAALPQPIEQVGEEEKRPASVAQLPPDAELGPLATGPELDLEAVTRNSPKGDLYEEVATVWLLIRRRGQQPTPELIAREIGPDTLAKFLNSFPGSEKMFGIDSDILPVNPPPDLSPPPKPDS